MSSGKTFDIKLGYKCNNHCVHCVVSPMVDTLVEQDKKIDLSYAEIFGLINSREFKEASNIVITGGEPTLRKDFMRIINTISKKYPEKQLILQTNGRFLYKFIDELKLIPNDIYYVVAIHSIDKEIHNKVVNNRIKDGNSYEETIKSLIKLRDSYSNFKDIGRIEIVLSRLNYKSLYKTIIGLHKLGINSIGISYPHLDGYYIREGVEKIKEIGLSYAELKTILPDIYNYVVENNDLLLSFEEVPKCVWRDEQNNLLTIPSNLDTGNDAPTDAVVKYPGRELTIDFNNIWKNIHIKPPICSSCKLCGRCYGVWTESFMTFKDEGLIPIK